MQEIFGLNFRTLLVAEGGGGRILLHKAGEEAWREGGSFGGGRGYGRVLSTFGWA